MRAPAAIVPAAARVAPTSAAAGSSVLRPKQARVGDVREAAARHERDDHGGCIAAACAAASSELLLLRRRCGVQAPGVPVGAVADVDDRLLCGGGGARVSADVWRVCVWCRDAAARQGAPYPFPPRALLPVQASPHKELTKTQKSINRVMNNTIVVIGEVGQATRWPLGEA